MTGDGQPRALMTHAIAASAALIAALSLASRVLGLIRDRALASAFGAGAILDAYYAAFRIPDFFFNLLGLGALTAAFLPIFIRVRQENRDRALAFASTVMSDIVVFLIVLCGIGAIAAQSLFAVTAPGFDAAQLALTVRFGRILFLATFLLGASTVVGGLLQAERRFLAFAFAPFCYNLGIIVGVVGFVPLTGPIGIAWGVVLGAVAHLAVQWAAARRAGFAFRWHPRWRDAQVRETIALLIPRMLGLASSQFQLLVVTAIASTLAAGSLAAFTFANNIQMVPVSLFGIAFAVAAFPHFAEAASARDRTGFQLHFSTTVRQIALLALPSVVLLLTLKAQAVRVFLGTGAFDWDDTVRTLQALEAFGFGLFWVMLIPLLARAFYALEDTRTPFIVGIVADAVGIMAAWFLGRPFGPRGLALAVSLAAVIQAFLLLILLRMRIGPLDGRRIAFSCAKFATAAFVMAIAIQVVKPLIAALTGTDTFIGIGLQGAVAAAFGLVVYFVVGILLRSAEITALAHALRRRALRVVQLPFGGADEARG